MNKIVLLVEDNLDDVELARHAFRKNNFRTELVVAHDGREAWNYLDRFAGTSSLPAMILLDLKLPRVDGLELLAMIRGQPALRRLPVIMLSSSAEPRDVTRSYELGANSYVRKPVDFAQFTEAVRQLGIYWLFLNEPPPLAARSLS